MIGVLTFVEAIQSTAMSHRHDCACDVCATARGDQEALERLLARIQIQARANARAASPSEVR